MIPPGDTGGRTFADHFWLIAFALFAFNALIWHCATAGRDAPTPTPVPHPLTTTQEYYESTKQP